MQKLTEVLKKIEQLDGVREFYLHRNYDTGSLELNIEFCNFGGSYGTPERVKADRIDEILTSLVEEKDISAYWE